MPETEFRAVMEKYFYKNTQKSGFLFSTNSIMEEIREDIKEIASSIHHSINGRHRDHPYGLSL